MLACIINGGRLCWLCSASADHSRTSCGCRGLSSKLCWCSWWKAVDNWAVGRVSWEKAWRIKAAEFPPSRRLMLVLARYHENPGDGFKRRSRHLINLIKRNSFVAPHGPVFPAAFGLIKWWDRLSLKSAIPHQKDVCLESCHVCDVFEESSRVYNNICMLISPFLNVRAS